MGVGCTLIRLACTTTRGPIESCSSCLRFWYLERIAGRRPFCVSLKPHHFIMVSASSEWLCFFCLRPAAEICGVVLVLAFSLSRSRERRTCMHVDRPMILLLFVGPGAQRPLYFHQSPE